MGCTKSLALTGHARARVPGPVPHSVPPSRSASGSLGKSVGPGEDELCVYVVGDKITANLDSEHMLVFSRR